MEEPKDERSRKTLNPKENAIEFLERVVIQAEFFTKTQSLQDDIKNLKNDLEIDTAFANRIQTLRRNLGKYGISDFQSEHLRKSLRHLEALVTPLEKLKEISSRKKQIAMVASTEIVENMPIGKDVLAVILDGTVSQDGAVEDSDIDIAVVVKDGFGKKFGRDKDYRFWEKANEVEKSICMRLNNKNLGVTAHDNMDSVDDHGGIHLRVIEVSSLDMGNVSGAGPTPRDGVVLYEKKGFNVKRS